MHSSSFDAVVARYREDVSWCDGFRGTATVTIYDKSGSAAAGAVPLPNVGREAHTYLHHICAHYEALRLRPRDVTVFLQGDIADHMPRATGEPCEYVAELARQAAADGISGNHVRGDAGGANGVVADFVIRRHRGMPVQPSRDDERLGLWFRRCFGAPLPPPQAVRWFPGAVFAVRNDRILARPPAAYGALLAEVGRDGNPVAGHYMERCWHLLFRDGR
jgi:hypothetical protein